MRQVLIILLILFSGLLFHCVNQEKEPEESITEEFTPDTTPTENVREIFYSLYLPDEISRIFENVGANFDPDIPNSPDNFSYYSEPMDIAISLGVYGVDLNYARLFEQNALTANYFTVIQILSEKLGISDNYYEDLFKRLENEYQNRDTVATIAGQVYERTDDFLKSRGQDSHAALIVFGAWIEALYIACEILEDNPENIEILDRIAEQKYSLNSLIFLLSNYNDPIEITEYVLMLKRLRKAFDRFEIYFQKDQFFMDTVNQRITASEYESEFDMHIASEISGIVREIRSLIVEY